MACSGLLGRRVRLVRALGLVDDGDERQLAAVIDLRDLDLDLLAHAQDVLDVLDALALVELAQLRLFRSSCCELQI